MFFMAEMNITEGFQLLEKGLKGKFLLSCLAPLAHETGMIQRSSIGMPKFPRFLAPEPLFMLREKYE